MKRVIMAAMLLVSTVSVFAADVKSDDRKIETKTELRKARKVAECSMTLTATVGPSYAQVQVTCKGSAETCKEAASIAKSCLMAAREIFK